MTAALLLSVVMARTSFAGYASEHYFNPLDWSSGQIRRIGTGRYEVDLFQLAGAYSRSTALVTAQSGAGDHCKVRRWTPSGSIVQVSVECYDAGGARKDSQFFLSFVTDRTFSATLASPVRLLKSPRLLRF